LCGRTCTATQIFSATSQVNGSAYDNVGNLTYDGTAAYTYDALNRTTGAARVSYDTKP